MNEVISLWLTTIYLIWLSMQVGRIVADFMGDGEMKRWNETNQKLMRMKMKQYEWEDLVRHSKGATRERAIRNPPFGRRVE